MSRVAFDAKRKAGVDKNYTVKEYTPESLAIDCISKLPIQKEDLCLDCSRGINPVWFNNFPTTNKDFCEIDEDKIFLEYNTKVDWVIGNPPFRGFVDFCYHASKISKKGFGFLINHSRLNQLTTKRLDDFAEKGFYFNGIFVVGVAKWFGRYYFVSFSKEKKANVCWERKTYKEGVGGIPTKSKDLDILPTIL